VEKMAAGRAITELPSLCFCTVSEKCLNINSQSHGHIHCPCEVCLGEVIYPTTAWRHLQRPKKARLSNEQDEEWSSLPNSEPGTSTSATNFSDDVDCERASACGFYSETASSGFCDFAENVSDRDETDSVNSEGSSNSGNMTVDEEEENADSGSDEDFYDSNGPDEDDNDSNGEGEDDVDNFIFDAIIRAIEMKDQMAISIQHFEDLLCWGKDLYFKKTKMLLRITCLLCGLPSGMKCVHCLRKLDTAPQNCTGFVWTQATLACIVCLKIKKIVVPTVESMEAYPTIT